mmetsp:Transcript_19492/g.30031  ORF Transcript_19492/g.30031 Transcript_19492/m.30031 type:complete len:134 (+) Transcript_19492:152-553(+)
MNKLFSEVEKLRKICSFLHPQGQMCHAYFVDNLKQEINQALQEAQNGAPVNYSSFTSKVTSGESEWLKDNEESAKVSSTSTAASSTSNATAMATEKSKKPKDHGWNTKPGEPTKHWIQGVDILIVYKQIYKLD